MNDHIPYMTLSEVVNEFCLATYNDKRKNYINHMIHAKWIWKELFQKTLFVVKNKYLAVDFTTNPYSILIPRDSVRVLNVSQEDIEGRVRSYMFDDNMNDVDLPTGDECSVCNQHNEYGQCINNMVAISNQVILLSQAYTDTTWKRLSPNGDLLEIKTKHVINYPTIGDPYVDTITQERRVCKLEVKTCGCVVKSPANLKLITDYCGVLLPTCQLSCLENLTNSTEARVRISNGRIWLKGNVPEFMIVSYQTNGVCNEEEIMVPETAVPSMMTGIYWRGTILAPNKNRLEKDHAKIMYDTDVEKLDMFLNPIRVKEFMDVQETVHSWGSGTKPITIAKVPQCAQPLYSKLVTVSDTVPASSQPSVIVLTETMEEFTGGTSSTLTLLHKPAFPNAVLVFLNGPKISMNLYTVDPINNTVTVNFAVIASDVIDIQYSFQ